ncbi:MAG TPA: hypothetical protein VF457_16545 [Burkholderiaceae bacterium]
MNEVETFAIAARLHVVLRRTLGRVTDVEWMTRNREYAQEVLRVARGHDSAELRDLADKFEQALSPRQRASGFAITPTRVAPAVAAEAIVPPRPQAAAQERYVGGLR